uniref:Uncharacterized protein n=1 Tax=Attheya septentrionalis TaxID=420275 RepID=A0A7S2XKZ1_9STRA|mmetsp:Transcript_10484/g.19116  ORF Transcript_10484/g.19116 Transcript_10484/m.19116 type:complete len:148 (+) Transcript_10484:211-654(+)
MVEEAICIEDLHWSRHLNFGADVEGTSESDWYIYPVGAEVSCWYTEENEDLFDGFVLDKYEYLMDSTESTGIEIETNPNTGDDTMATHQQLRVRFDEDGQDHWIPAVWCDPHNRLRTLRRQDHCRHPEKGETTILPYFATFTPRTTV